MVVMVVMAMVIVKMVKVMVIYDDGFGEDEDEKDDAAGQAHSNS